MTERAKTISVQDNTGWQKLIEFMKCCKWKKRYDSGTLDGTQWELKAKGAGISIETYGSNAYPVDFDEFFSASEQNGRRRRCKYFKVIWCSSPKVPGFRTAEFPAYTLGNASTPSLAGNRQ